MKTILTVLALALAFQGEKKSNPQFEKLKKLEGSWESADKEHPVAITYRPGSSGTVVVETISMGNHGDMITVYHPEGDGLAMTHYCAMGNQPHMKAEKESTAGAIKFVCCGGSNFACASDQHMHSLVLTFVDADHLKHDWTLYAGGKEAGVHTFNLVRKKKE